MPEVAAVYMCLSMISQVPQYDGMYTYICKELLYPIYIFAFSGNGIIYPFVASVMCIAQNVTSQSREFPFPGLFHFCLRTSRQKFGSGKSLRTGLGENLVPNGLPA